MDKVKVAEDVMRAGFGPSGSGKKTYKHLLDHDLFLLDLQRRAKDLHARPDAPGGRLGTGALPPRKDHLESDVGSEARTEERRGPKVHTCPGSSRRHVRPVPDAGPCVSGKFLSYPPVRVERGEDTSVLCRSPRVEDGDGGVRGGCVCV